MADTVVVRQCREMTAKLEGIEGEFTIRSLVVRGLTHPVNLGQHFLGCHWCSLDFTAGCTQPGVWGQSVQLVDKTDQPSTRGRQGRVAWRSRRAADEEVSQEQVPAAGL